MKKTVSYLMLGMFVVGLSACAGIKGGSDVEDASSAEATTVSVDSTSATDSSRDPEAGLNSVFYFEFDKSSLTAETQRDLDAYARALRESPRNIRLEGHADERGTREYNIALGERRAKAVADYLMNSGVSAGNIETISYGEERPAVNGSNSSAWAQNRRVELK